MNNLGSNNSREKGITDKHVASWFNWSKNCNCFVYSF